MAKRRENTHDSTRAQLQRELHATGQALREAYDKFNYVSEPELVDACVYEISALKARCNYLLRRLKEDAVAADRRSQVGSGDRSERIRTYNFPQGRVTDHRIGLTLHKIDAVLNGELDEILSALITADQAERLKQVE